MKKFISIAIIFAMMMQTMSVGAVKFVEMTQEEYDAWVQSIQNAAIEDEPIAEVVTEEYEAGVIPMTEEELNAFHSTLTKIVDVKPNEIALKRALEESKAGESVLDPDSISAIAPAKLGQEMVYQNSNVVGTMSLQTEEFDLQNVGTEFPVASSADNSLELSFPPIGKQGLIKSDVAWSMAYYQLTNNINVVRGLNARDTDSEPINSNIMSPKFTYQLANHGVDAGLTWDEAAAALSVYGCPDSEIYPREMTSENVVEWSKDSSVWNDALTNRAKKITYDTLTDTTVNYETDFVERLKGVLCNGYVVSVSSYGNNYITTEHSSTGETALRYVAQNIEGQTPVANALTVVGYSDDYWIDVNDDGYRNTDEYGAFKVVNSRGKTWNDTGYIWIAYDALGQQTAVSGGPTEARVPFFTTYYFIETMESYTPLLTAEVTMTTTNRNQISVSFGISNTDSTTPAITLDAVRDTADINYYIPFNKPYDANNLSCNFAGQSAVADTATIPFDLTPLISEALYNSDSGINVNAPIRLYINVKDEVNDGSTVSLTDVKIIESAYNQEVSSSDTTTLITDNNTVTKTVDFTVSPILMNENDQDMEITFNSNLLESNAYSGNIFIMTDKWQNINSDKIVEDNIIYFDNASGVIKSGYYFVVSDFLMSRGGNHFGRYIQATIQVVPQFDGIYISQKQQVN